MKNKLYHITNLRKYALLFTFLCFTMSALAQKTATKDTIAKDTLKAKPVEKTPEQKRAEDYAKLIKKATLERKGLFTVRKADERWYFEIPDSLIGRYFLCITRLKSAPQGLGKYAGESVNEQTIYFEQKTDKTLYLRAFINKQEADSTSNIFAAVQNSKANPVVAAFNVIGRNPKTKAQLIDITDFFKKDNSITSFTSNFKSDKKLTAAADDRSALDDIHTYPINVEVLTTKTYPTSSGGTFAATLAGAVSVELNVSIVVLPKVPMQKRIFDPRVGYFTKSYIHFSDAQQRTETQAFIQRFRLEPRKEDVKKYLSGALVRPKKQIVFYIDPATPKQWQPYLIQGVNDWNAAFEQAGFKDAITAKPWPNDPSMSMEDARYSVIRYLASETSNAYGPRISDPRSGEIIESHVGWYHNVMKLVQQWYMVQAGAIDKRARKMQFDEALMGELVRFVSSHEVGHALGLRHNMGASYATPVEKLRDKAWVEANGHTVSIMDYARFNYVAQPEDHVSPKGIYPRIGVYDKWAIEWGYRWYGNKYRDAQQEQEALAEQISDRLKKDARLWFGGEGTNDDPRSQTEDLSSDVMKANTYGLKNLRYVVANLLEWTKQPNDKYEYLSDSHKSAVGQYRRYLNHVLKHFGGRYSGVINSPEVYQAVPKEKLKEAIDYLDRELFEPPLWLYPEVITSKTGADPHREINDFQTSAIEMTLRDRTLSRLANDALLTKNAYPLEQYLKDLAAAVWKPLGSDPQKAAYRRDLQGLYVEALGKNINPTAPKDGRKDKLVQHQDVPLYALQHLLYIEETIGKLMQKEPLGSLNHLHYQTLLKEIKEIKDPKK